MTTLEELKARYRREVGDLSPAPLSPSLNERAEALVGQRAGGSQQNQKWTPDVDDPYPLTLHFPAGARIATIEGQWQRLPDGTIEARFNTRKELAWALAAVGCDGSEVLEALQ